MKRKIMLFVDDTLEYHQQLKKGNELQNTYDILFAEDGDKAIEKIKYYKIRQNKPIVKYMKVW